MKLLKGIGTSNKGTAVETAAGGNTQNQDNPTTTTDSDEFNGFDPSYADFVRETQQGVAAFVNGHYVPPPSTKGGNCPDGYIS